MDAKKQSILNSERVALANNLTIDETFLAHFIQAGMSPNINDFVMSKITNCAKVTAFLDEFLKHGKWCTLLEALKETGQHHLAEKLMHKDETENLKVNPQVSVGPMPRCSSGVVMAPVAEFYESDKYKEARQLILKDSKICLILTGLVGSGKTQIARQLNFELSQSHDAYMSRWFNCCSSAIMRDELSSFCTEINIEYDPKGSAAYLLKQIFGIMNAGRYKNKLIILIFNNLDDHDVFAEILQMVFEEEQLRKDGRKEHNLIKWKIIVTSEAVLDWNRRRHIAVCQVDVNGFSLQDAKQMVQDALQRDIHIDVMAKDLFELFQGSALGFVVALEELSINYKTGQGERYLNKLRREATAIVKEGAQNRVKRNVVAALAISIRKVLDEEPELVQPLKVIALFGPHMLPENLLLSCLESVASDASLIVNKLILAIKRRHLGVWDVVCKGISECRMLTINRLVLEALRATLLTDPEKCRGCCRKALISLSRVSDFDGRFHGQFHATARHNVAHGRVLMNYVLEQERTDKTFSDPLMLILSAVVLAAEGYFEMEKRHDVEKGVQKLNLALDRMLTATSEKLSYGDLAKKYKDTSEESEWARQVGDHLFRSCDVLLSSLDDKFIADIPRFKRLSQRDQKVLGIDDLDDGHLSESDLERLLKSKEILPLNVLKTIFPAELLAMIFHLLSRKYDFSKSENDVKMSLESATIAKEIYRLIHSKMRETGVLLYSICSHRSEELPLRAKHLEIRSRDSASGPQEQSFLEILKEYEGLELIEGKAYEFGVMRSVLEKDDYHKLLCLEQKLLIYGCLYQLTNKIDYKQKGEKLFQECCKLVAKMPNKSQSYALEFYAKFLHCCNQFPQAIDYTIQSMRKLDSAIDDQHCSSGAVLEPRFKELCMQLLDYVKSVPGLNLKAEHRDYLQRLSALKFDQPNVKNVLDSCLGDFSGTGTA